MQTTTPTGSCTISELPSFSSVSSDLSTSAVLRTAFNGSGTCMRWLSLSGVPTSELISSAISRSRDLSSTYSASSSATR
ncbi:MAG: hypothetical protein K0Q76_79 [Panacagrimonas sp.]|nr:hypothetical protein [Panacagrimonas sp.]